MAKELGYSGTNHGNVNTDELSKALKQGFLVIISIKWAFEDHRTLKEKILFWKKTGGHLALVIGFEEENGKSKGFYVHHTSICPKYNWQYKFLPLDKFRQGFTGRCVFIKP